MRRGQQSWREMALGVIHETYVSIRAAQPPTVSDEQCLRMVSRNYYPWGSRENWPYKSWLRAIKEYRRAIGGQPRVGAMKETPLFDLPEAAQLEGNS